MLSKKKLKELSITKGSFFVPTSLIQWYLSVQMDTKLTTSAINVMLKQYGFEFVSKRTMNPINKKMQKINHFGLSISAYALKKEIELKRGCTPVGDIKELLTSAEELLVKYTKATIYPSEQQNLDIIVDIINKAKANGKLTQKQVNLLNTKITQMSG